MDIQRYSYDEGDGNWRFPGHIEDDEGKFVYYEDHLEIVKGLEEKHRQELEQVRHRAYREGKDSNIPSWRL